MKTCYACNEPAVTREHVPPKSFFPAKEDLPSGLDLRRNLIRVPSCQLHNTSKSKDDEYLLFVIVSNYETNPVAQHHFSTKLLRAIRRRPSVAALFVNGQPINVDGQDTWVYYPDEQRVFGTMELMAKAIHYHHQGTKWSAPLHLIVPPLLRVRAALSPDYAARLAYVEALVSQWFEHEPFHGNNPEVFYYQLRPGSSPGEQFIRMVFYGFFSWIAMEREPVERARQEFVDA